MSRCQERRIAEGRCVDCPSVPAPGRVRCDACAEINRAKGAERERVRRRVRIAQWKEEARGSRTCWCECGGWKRYEARSCKACWEKDESGSPLMISALRVHGGRANCDAIALELGVNSTSYVHTMMARARSADRVRVEHESDQDIAAPRLDEWRSVKGEHGKYYVFKPKRKGHWGKNGRVVYALKEVA